MAGQFDLPKEKINAFQLADKIGRRAKASAVNRSSAAKAVDDQKQGFDRLIKGAKEAKKLRKGG